MTASIGKASRAGVYWTVGLKFVHQAYHVAIMLLVARLLGPSVFGVMALAWAMAAFVDQWTRFGITRAIIHREDLASEEVDTAFTYCLVASLAGWALLASLAPGLAWLFEIPDLETVLPVLAMIFPVSAYYSICAALLQRDLSFQLFAVSGMVEGFVSSTGMLVLALLGYGIWAIVLSKVLGSLVATVTVALATGWIPRINWRVGNLRPMLNYASLELLRGHVRYIESYVSYWIVGYHMAPAALGLLDRAQSIARVPVLAFQTQVSAVLFPSFSCLRTDLPRLNIAFAKSLTAVAVLMTGPLVGLASVSGVLVPVILGPDWQPMTSALQVLCIASVFRILANTSQNLNLATAGYKRETARRALCALMSIAACLAGLHWGVLGVSVALLASAVTTFALSVDISLRILDSGPRLLAECLMPAIVGSLLMSGTVWVLRQSFLPTANMSCLVLSISVGAIVYVAWMLCIRHDGVRAIRRDVLADLWALLHRVKPSADEGSK